MESIAVTKPDMSMLSQERLHLSPFGALAQAFAAEVLARAEQSEGVWSFVPLELLEEEATPTVPAPPSKVVLHVDLQLVLDALRREGSRAEHQRATQRIVERILQMQAKPTASSQKEAPSAPDPRSMAVFAAVRQEFYQNLNSNIRISLSPSPSQGFFGSAAQKAEVFSRHLQTRLSKGSPYTAVAKLPQGNAAPLQSGKAAPHLTAHPAVFGPQSFSGELLTLLEDHGNRTVQSEAGTPSANLLRSAVQLQKLAQDVLNGLTAQTSSPRFAEARNPTASSALMGTSGARDIRITPGSNSRRSGDQSALTPPPGDVIASAQTEGQSPAMISRTASTPPVSGGTLSQTIQVQTALSAVPPELAFVTEGKDASSVQDRPSSPQAAKPSGKQLQGKQENQEAQTPRLAEEKKPATVLPSTSTSTAKDIRVTPEFHPGQSGDEQIPGHPLGDAVTPTQIAGQNPAMISRTASAPSVSGGVLTQTTQGQTAFSAVPPELVFVTEGENTSSAEGTQAASQATESSGKQRLEKRENQEEHAPRLAREKKDATPTSSTGTPTARDIRVTPEFRPGQSGDEQLPGHPLGDAATPAQILGQSPATISGTTSAPSVSSRVLTQMAQGQTAFSDVSPELVFVTEGEDVSSGPGTQAASQAMESSGKQPLGKQEKQGEQASHLTGEKKPATVLPSTAPSTAKDIRVTPEFRPGQSGNEQISGHSPGDAAAPTQAVGQSPVIISGNTPAPPVSGGVLTQTTQGQTVFSDTPPELVFVTEGDSAASAQNRQTAPQSVDVSGKQVQEKQEGHAPHSSGERMASAPSSSAQTTAARDIRVTPEFHPGHSEGEQTPSHPFGNAAVPVQAAGQSPAIRSGSVSALPTGDGSVSRTVSEQAAFPTLPPELVFVTEGDTTASAQDRHTASQSVEVSGRQVQGKQEGHAPHSSGERMASTPSSSTQTTAARDIRTAPEFRPGHSEGEQTPGHPLGNAAVPVQDAGQNPAMISGTASTPLAGGMSVPQTASESAALPPELVYLTEEETTSSAQSRQTLPHTAARDIRITPEFHSGSPAGENTLTHPAGHGTAPLGTLDQRLDSLSKTTSALPVSDGGLTLTAQGQTSFSAVSPELVLFHEADGPEMGQGGHDIPHGVETSLQTVAAQASNGAQAPVKGMDGIKARRLSPTVAQDIRMNTASRRISSVAVEGADRVSSPTVSPLHSAAASQGDLPSLYLAAPQKDGKTAQSSAAHSVPSQMETLPLTYGPTQGAASRQSTAANRPPEPAQFTGSDYVRSLPDWAQRFLQSSTSDGAAAPRSMGVAREIASLPAAPAQEEIQWSAPDYHPPATTMTHHIKKQEEPPRERQELHISEAEIQRTADQVYQIIEDRIRRERRRMGL